MEYRRGWMRWAVEGTDDDRPQDSLVDSLRQTLLGAGDLLDGDEYQALQRLLHSWNASARGGLPERGLEVEVFRDWLDIDSPKEGHDRDSELCSHFPLSMWFFRRIVDNEANQGDWNNWQPGRVCAKRLMDLLKGFVELINNRNDQDRDKAKCIRFAVPLQRILCMTPAELDWLDNPFELRPSLPVARAGSDGGRPLVKHPSPMRCPTISPRSWTKAAIRLV